MESYDIVVIGASTTGSYFAARAAERGFKVLLIEKSTREAISPAYDIFHMGKGEMAQFSLPAPEGSVAAFEFCDSTTNSAYGHYPKPGKSEVVGMHKGEYIRQLNDFAVQKGVTLLYGAQFKSAVLEDGKITGVRFMHGGEEKCVSCRLAADCSGIPAVLRTSLPDGYGVENSPLGVNDIFFVVLRYVRFKQELPKWLHSDSWLYYKTWLAPSGEDNGAILGIGANFGYDYAEKVFDLFSKNVKLPEYTVTKTERGGTPYRRTPFSFVGDGFVAMGDAACLTKPFSGEGCTSSMVQADIVLDVISEAMRDGAYPSRDALWGINKRYNDTQGADFAGMFSLLINIVRHSIRANEFFFKHDVIFSEKMLSGLGDGAELTTAEYVKTALWLVFGVISFRVKPSEIASILRGIKLSGEMSALYREYPATPDGFPEWVMRADALWRRVGSMADWKPL